MTTAIQSQSRLTRYLTLAALALSAMTTIGCSTPPVTGAAAREEANSAYDNCVYSLTPYGRAADCNTTTTYTTTTYSVPTYQQYGDYRQQQQPYYGYVNGKTELTEQELREEYINSLDEESLKDLTKQWNDLAAQASI
jgi:hypothetical protein